MKYTLDPSPRALGVANGLSLRDALNQVLCPLLAFTPTEPYGAAHIPSGTLEEVEKKVAEFRAVCEIPPLCTADLECGAAGAIRGATPFPDLMALGANDSEKLAYEVGKATALEGRAAGINWTFSPCVDLAIHPDSPVVSTRSAGRQVERVVRTAKGYFRGLQDHGLLATLKHFPGDGDTSYDQHLTTVQNPLSMEQWWRGPGTVYRQLIAAGAKTIMAGHISLPAYDELDSALHLHPPATLSRRLLTQLLREELGFSGLIVSDAMGMGGVAGFTNPYESYARFLEAGGDCVLFPMVENGRCFVEMERLLQQGLLKERTIYHRAARMIAIKEDLGLLDDSQPPAPYSVAEHTELSQRVTDGAATLVRDRRSLLPFSLEAESRVLHVIVANNYERERAVYQALTRALGTRSKVQEEVDPGPSRLFDLVESNSFDLVICSIGAVHEWGTSVTRLHGPICRNLMQGWMRLSTPVVFISHFHPFVHLEFEAAMDCVINTFRSLETSAERAVRGITGEQPFTGKF